MKANFCYVPALFSFYFTLTQGYSDDFLNNTGEMFHERSEILSRRKRFLVFPEGSSFQMVFCHTFPAITIGDIFLWGYTAALAYELPQDPYSPFRHHADPLHRRVDSKVIYYVNEDGGIIGKRPYKKKFLVNPAFAKRSVDGLKTVGFKKGTDRKQMHASEHKRQFLKRERVDDGNVEFHRTGRSALYRKIETMLQGLGGPGRQCMLKTLCLVGQTRGLPQGTFAQEILRAVFTLPEGKFSEPEDQEYDEASSATGSCEELYPECNHHFEETV